MLVTASTVRAATSVKSGPVGSGRDGDVADAGWADPAAGAAVAWSADRMRPVSTRPAAKPAKTRRLMKAKRRATSADVDAARRVAGRLGHGHREHAVAELGGDVVGTNRAGQREAAMERAVASLHPVVALARDIGLASRALQRELSVVKPDVDVLAQEARQLSRDDEGVRGLVEIDRRGPASRFDARELLHPFLEGEQVAQRIPARESHPENRSMFEEFAGSVVLS